MTDTSIYSKYRENLYKILISVLLITAMAVSGTVNVQAQEEFTYPVMSNMLDVPEVETAADDTTMERLGVSYPKVYDPRKSGKVTSVKNQGSYNCCWAFSTVAAIESNLIKKGIADRTIDLSENQIAYFFYNRISDSLGYTKSDKNVAKVAKWINNGGSITATALSLSTWSGVVAESKSKYGSTPNKSLCYASDYIVKNSYKYEYSVNGIKQAITSYGAVASGIYMDNQYYNLNTSAYYCNVSNGNHAVAIVGWNDNYSRTNFNSSIRPKNNGAWIVKNSYGTDFGDNGYMYVSYEDKSLSDIVAYDMIKASASYDNNYQHDGSASPYTCRLNNGTKAANVFTAKAAGKYNEILKAVSVNTYTTNTKYSLQIYTGLTDAKNPESGKAMFSKPQTGTLKNAGYSQIILKKPVTLVAGEKFSVVLQISSSNQNVAFGTDASYENDWIKFSAYAGKNRSFVNTGNTWIDIGNRMGMILRIKAYTDNTKKVSTYKISKKKVTLSKGKTIKLSVVISPSEVKKKIIWTSSNKRVATVNGKGVVKGKASGKAVIKAKFVAGSSTKTLQCKVTVKNT